MMASAAEEVGETGLTEYNLDPEAISAAAEREREEEEDEDDAFDREEEERIEREVRTGAGVTSSKFNSSSSAAIEMSFMVCLSKSSQCSAKSTASAMNPQSTDSQEVGGRLRRLQL